MLARFDLGIDMKRWIGATAALAALGAVSAQAADLAPRPYTKAPAYVAPVYNWGGFYVGAHIGYGWGRAHTDQFLANGTFDQNNTLDRDGVFGGGQIGYNLMLSPNWLIGIEADISGADIKGSADNVNGTATIHSRSTVDYFGTVRGRLGYAVDNVLFYGTGGLLWAHGTVNRDVTVGAITENSSFTTSPTGWTAGGGVEWGFLPNWSAKVEYLYGELKTSGDLTFATFVRADRHLDSNTQLHSIRVGVNYHFGGPAVARY
jgi:outer membrane immunogenic protein